MGLAILDPFTHQRSRLTEGGWRMGFLSMMLGVVAPHLSSPRPGETRNPYLLALLGGLILWIAWSLWTGARKRIEGWGSAWGLEKRTAFIPGGFYRIVASGPAKDGFVTLCIDQRPGHGIAISEGEIKEIFRPSASLAKPTQDSGWLPLR